MELLGEDGQRGGEPQVRHDPDSVGRLGHDVTEVAQHGSGVGHGPCQDAGEHRGTERPEPVLEGRDDPEVATAAPQCPAEVRMLLGAGDEAVAFGSGQVAGHEVVDGEPEATHQVADPTSERQSADAGMSDDATGHGELPPADSR